ncbi:chemotaxis protein CheW, partial [Amphritea sp. 1_MG-2023]|uniref:chemotaxis protein CheW n=1 Tax=Amphritea sp. 1_MG-2023 TaxID=3062670 RepID=UPI0026E46ABD
SDLHRVPSPVPDVDPDRVPEPEPEPEPAPAPQPEPVVAAQPLQCLLVKMYGVKLALPIEYLQGAHDISAMKLGLHHDAEWILGSYDESGTLVDVVDTGMWIIPERYDPAKASYTELVKFKGEPWAMTIDSMLDSQAIDESLITWNNNSKARPWLLGTCMQYQCAVINVPALLAGFNAALHP